jgi:uncharacterized protein
MLCDTGPIVGVLDADDSHHVRSIETFKSVACERLITTLPCLTEAMYMLWRAGGYKDQQKLWTLLDRDSIYLWPLEKLHFSRMRSLMTKYSDHPMDFADASLVVAAEAMGETKIVTFDQHFRAYLIHDRIPFEVIP